MELGLGPLVGRAMPRDVSRGGCGLRKSLGSLSVDGWGCIPTLLVVWSEELEPTGCWVGPGLGANDSSKMSASNKSSSR